MDLVTELLEDAIKDGVFPGACYAIWNDGDLVQGSVGNHTYDRSSPSVTLGTVWDLASVSKVVGTTTAAMILNQEGLLDLDEPVCSVIPEFGGNGKDRVTFRNLLVHDSGLVAFRPYHLQYQTAAAVMDAIYNEKLTYETGSDTIYSDLSMILVAEAITRISGQRMDDFLRHRVFEPLAMYRTGYVRDGVSTAIHEVTRCQCAPTEEIEPWRTELRMNRFGRTGSERFFGENPLYIQGEVHDPTATVLGGVAGHAGLFSTIGDLAQFLTVMMSRTGEIINPVVWDTFVTRQSPKSSRALGWDTKSPSGSSAGEKFGSTSFGHTGYTGTSIWCDPAANKFGILLTNRVHPTSKNTKIIALRPRFYDLI